MMIKNFKCFLYSQSFETKNPWYMNVNSMNGMNGMSSMSGMSGMNGMNGMSSMSPMGYNGMVSPYYSAPQQPIMPMPQYWPPMRPEEQRSPYAPMPMMPQQMDLMDSWWNKGIYPGQYQSEYGPAYYSFKSNAQNIQSDDKNGAQSISRQLTTNSYPTMSQ